MKSRLAGATTAILMLGATTAVLLLGAGAGCGSRRWPVIHGLAPALDTTKLVTIPGDSATLYRTEAIVVFRDGTSDAAKRAFVVREGLQVLGVTPDGRVFVRFADPGASIEAYDAVLTNLRQQPEVLRTVGIFRSGLREIGSITWEARTTVPEYSASGAPAEGD